MPHPGLTNKQREVYVFIEAYIDSRHRPPTLQEICDAIGAKSVNSAQKLVKSLEQKGYIKREKGRARSLSVTSPSAPSRPPVDGVQEIPIRRAGSSGDTPLAKLLAERLRVDRRFFRGIASTGSCFAVRAGDHAMQPDGIFRGDLVIAESVQESRIDEGELVVCARRGEFLIRRYAEIGSLAALVASDPSFATIHPESAQTRIEGRVIAVMRRL